MQKLRETIPMVRCIDLRRNLLSSINNLYGIHCLKDTLIDLDLSHNRLNMFYCFDNSNNNNNGSKNFDIFNKIFKIPQTFKNLKRLILNNTSSLKTEEKKSDDDDITQKRDYYFNAWEFVYYLIVNDCIPNIHEIEICDNHLNTLKLYLPKYGDFEDKNMDNWDMILPDASLLAKNVSKLQIINIGSNDLSDWNQISYLFGPLNNLKKLQASWCQFETITYDSDEKENDATESQNDDNDNNNNENEYNQAFSQLTTLFVRNNQFKNISLFDQLNKFPKLNNVLFLQSKFASIFGNCRLRDFAIAKMKKLRYFFCVLLVIIHDQC